MTYLPYFDCNATTPMEPEVAEVVRHFFEVEYANAGSSAHEPGKNAKRVVDRARAQIAEILCSGPGEVIFTSGATESNNLAILGLKAHGERTGRKHIVSTTIEHKAVLEPLAQLRFSGWDATLVHVDESGRVDADAVLNAVRDDTLLVSVMHVNNETGVIQPIEEIAAELEGTDAYFHVDAAQGFGKEISDLQDPLVDLISISGHKIYGPKGIGALIARRRGLKKIPLSPLIFGGGQERGLRAGTLPVPLIAGFGKAAEMAVRDRKERTAKVLQIGRKVHDFMTEVGGKINGSPHHLSPHVLNFSIPGVDSVKAIKALADLVAISNGSACNSSAIEPSYVLSAMGLPIERVEGALRFSWCHMTGEPDWDEVSERLKVLL